MVMLSGEGEGEAVLYQLLGPYFLLLHLNNALFSMPFCLLHILLTLWLLFRKLLWLRFFILLLLQFWADVLLLFFNLFW
jgi:hypothetical protein